MRAALVSTLLVIAGTAAADDTATALRTPERLKLRAHVATMGAFGLTAERNAGIEFDGRDGASYDDVPVVAVRGDRVRIVHDEDDARMLLWVDAADLSWTVLRETRLSGKGDVGVWLLRGAKVEASGSGGRRRVVARFDGDVVVRGMVPASAVGKVFEHTTAPPATPDERQAPALLDAPDGNPLVESPAGLAVTVIAPGTGEWLLVEHRSRTLRVRGWMRDRDATDVFAIGTTGTGGGYGMSHTRRVAVASGTCLHTVPGGPIAGIQLAAIERYSPDDQAGWWQLYVGNAWGLFTVWAHATSVDAAGKPTFAPCRF